MKYSSHKDRPFTAIKLIKKTRSKKVCRGCDKEIPIGSTCISTYELLGCRFANDYFHDSDCIKKFVKEVFQNYKESMDWLQSMITKSLK